MELKVGCDLVHIGRFAKSVEGGGQSFLEKIFSTYELATVSETETLAGMFAAKEAVIKALGFQPGEWQKIEVVKAKNGRPTVRLLEKGVRGEITISHDGEYAVALAVFMV